MANSKAYGLENNKAASNNRDGSEHVVKADEAFANVFFDGTKNNIFNTRAREAGQGIKDEDSFENDATSTALMWSGIKDEKLLNAVYIDGIGTNRLQKDVQDGYAFGKGETGITARARGAFAAINKTLFKNRNNELPARLSLNVYGFSRGAATARHFVHLVNADIQARKQGAKTKSLPSDWKDMKLDINFVGLFDTVSSYAPGTMFDLDFTNDVAELHLNFAEGYVQRVLHLVAGDEYRENFSVTTIASAGKAGCELVIPGAHSDVGGSYVDGAPEERFFPGHLLRQFVYDQGWYSAQDKHDLKPVRGQPVMTDLYRHERSVSSDYSKVAHAIMVDAANTHLQEQVFKDPKPAKDGDVKQLQTTLRAFAKDKFANKKNGHWDLNKEMPAQAKAIRRKLFHVSFSSQFGMALRREGNTPRRLVIAG